MSIERIFYCDWRDCEGHIRTASAHPPDPFITVADGTSDSHHFCTWDCLLKFAGEKPPAETFYLK